MAKGKVSIDYKLCMSCGACVQACPFGCLELTKLGLDKYKNAFPELVKNEKCTGCGICRDACPIESIEIIEK